ncbi:MAG: NADH-quinone oxidoreductase subunit L [Candidatus Omnitrophica bacterium]|nr:NADH-quinone oxidoreductase subunit L [Candidatus Omnitrophota bacterium]
MVEALAASAWLIPFFPAMGSLVNGLWGRRFIKKRAHWIAVPAVFLSCCLSVGLFCFFLKYPFPYEIVLYEWFPAMDFHVEFGFLFDGLSSIMLLVITGVGLLIHIYSIGYMHEDGGYARYFTYLNLFIFFMLILVLANNYLLMFLGWEGVGLCSYLLIGFWFHKKSASDAAKKAFIVNRIGDAGFMLGILLLFFTVGNLSYRPALGEPSIANVGGAATAIALLLFIGAVGKSAQIPLYVWLPDAMEGPTPVSALIHAATMVTAGIYMVCRSRLLYQQAPLAMEIVAVTGAATALFAATIALVQNDIKKVLAYSTVSQLGFMFLAVGVGAFASGMFHLVTHAFFKGLLFLGAGSVIHAASGEQNIQRLGGLKGHLPITFVTFVIAVFAIAGVPPLAGFWSKDEILTQTFLKGHPFLFGIGCVAALLTSFYMFRLLYLTFYGKTRLSEKEAHPLHESPRSMTVPLILLAFLSVVGGALLGFPPEEGMLHRIFEKVSFETLLIEPSGHAVHAFASLHALLMGTSIAIALFGWFLAWLLYRKRTDLPAKLVSRMMPLYTLLLHRYWVDELYDKTVLALCRGMAKVSFACDLFLIDGAVNGIGRGAVLLSKVKLFFDEKVVDGAANAIAALTQASSDRLRKIQTGGVQNYALTMTGGLVFLIALVLTLFQ